MATRSDRILALVKKQTELETRLSITKESLQKAREESQRAETAAELYKACTELLVNTSLTIQRKTTDKIAQIVTDLYQYVFLSEDRFVIKVDTKRSVPVASFFIETKKDGKTILLDPLKSDGGGKVDVLSLGLRLAALLLYRPALNKVLILDEPLRFLSSTATSSKPYRLRAVEFLKQIAHEYNIQVIAVTHDTELMDLADTVYEVSLNEKGYSEVAQHIK